MVPILNVGIGISKKYSNSKSGTRWFYVDPYKNQAVSMRMIQIGKPIDSVFPGSYYTSRISDFRAFN
jgi:hypothetical protein